MILISVNQQDLQLKSFFFMQLTIKGKDSWPLIAQIFADKKSIAKGLVTINMKIILIANWNKLFS